MFKYIVEYRGAKTGMWRASIGAIYDTPEQAKRSLEKSQGEVPIWEWRVSKWEFKGEI